MEYAVMNNQKTMLPSEQGEEIWMIFHEDGKSEVMSFGDEFISEWKNKEGNTLILIDSGGKIEQTIEKLTKEKLVLSYSIDGKTEKLGLRKQD